MEINVNQGDSAAPFPRLRASVQLRQKPARSAVPIEMLGGGTEVIIIEQSGDWLRVQPARLGHAIAGYVPIQALSFPPRRETIFPAVTLPDGNRIDSLCPEVKVSTLLDWFTTLDRPAWIPAQTWDGLGTEIQQAVITAVIDAIQARKAEWDAWMGEVRANKRLEEASLEEWLALLQGGKDVWTVRAEMIYPEPSSERNGLGWAVERDILRWTGRIRRNEREPRYKDWYEVQIFKLNTDLRGWFKGLLLDPYIFPNPENDPAFEDNKRNIFDLSRPLVRLPDDPEILEAMLAGRSGAQYIDIQRALGTALIHYNLCGEFCVAALAGVNVIDLLNAWKGTYPRALQIMRSNEGTGLYDLLTMLKQYGMRMEEFRYAPAITPVSPHRLRSQIQSGRMAIAGVGILRATGRLCGKESDPRRITRHWVLLEDVVPVGGSGWVRLYNPFHNREEVYTYDVFADSMGQFGLGCWVPYMQPGGSQ